MVDSTANIRAVLFDLDETLLDDDKCMRQTVASTCASLAHLLPDLDADKLGTAYFRISDHVWRGVGGVPRASGSGASSGAEIRLEIWRQALSLCGYHDREIATQAVALYGQARRDTYRLFPDTRQALVALAPKFKLGIITNGTGDVQREKIALTGLAEQMSAILVSGELGTGKPAPAIFWTALHHLGVSAGQAVHVGDSLTYDIAGAKAAGVLADWMNRGRAPAAAGDPVPDYQVRSLSGLVSLLLPGECAG